jgi:monoamine oxidase
VEARDRVGGRAWTVQAGDDAIDLGCGWLHSADQNLFARAAEAFGFPIDKTEPPWMRQAFGIEFSAAEREAFGKALQALEERIEAAASAGEDRPVAELMQEGSPWNAALHAFSTYYNGAGFDEISTVDYDAFDDTEVNWRTPRGYGALVATFGAGAPVLFNTRVDRIDHSGSGVRLETASGAIEARCVIITAPTPLIADGRIAFVPDLAELRDAAAALPLGLANKVFLRLAEPQALPVESHLFGDISRVETGSYHLRPFGRDLIELYLGGRNARTLEGEGPGAAAAFAIEELARLLGSAIRDKLGFIAESRWAADTLACGSYSYALPGCAHLRAAYGRAIDDRIFIAGEAASPNHFSTAHGAAETGIAAARAALEALGRGPQQSTASEVVGPRP